MARALTSIEGKYLLMNYLESMRVVVNLGGVYGIPLDNEVKPMERGERAQSQPQDVSIGGVPTDPFQSRVCFYLDNF